MQQALGIAGSMGAGLMAAQEGAMVKRLHAGRAAQSGMLSALLAKRGFTGIPDVIEASYGGFLSSFSRTPNVERLLEGLHEDWEVRKIGFKMYPNVTIVYTKKDETTYQQDLLNALASGKGPDIFAISNSWLPEYIDKIVPAATSTIDSPCP